MLRPGRHFVRAIVLLAAFALLITAFVAMVWAVLLALFVLVGLAAAESWALLRVRFVGGRPEKIALALDEIEAIPFEIRTTASRPLQLIIRQTWPETIEGRASERTAVCRPGEVVKVEMPVRAIARGTSPIEQPWIAATFRGLIERVTPVQASTELHVLPNLRAVKRLHKQLNAYALRGMGARSAPRLGKGREFDRLRDYVSDDDYRDIAWRASARHGRLIVREFRLDRSQDILICLDRGHRMAARVAQITRLDHAVNATVLISYICNRMEDRAGIVAFDTDVDKGIVAGRGSAHLRAITSYVTSLEAAYRYTDYLAMATQLRRRLHHRTLILMLTVLPEREERFGLLRAVELLAGQHLPLVIALSDPNLKASARFLPSNREELARTLVARELWTNRLELMRDLRARGALVVESTPEDAGIDAVNAYIDVKRRQVL
jgi:uncharacterized protein (DUF58 family)